MYQSREVVSLLFVHIVARHLQEEALVLFMPHTQELPAIKSVHEDDDKYMFCQGSAK